MTLNKQSVACSAMLLGPILVFGLVLLMNRYASDLDKEKATPTSHFEVVKQIKPKPKKKTKKRKPKKIRQTARAPAPFKGLNSALSGIDLGMLGLEGDLDDLNGSLLGKKGGSVMTEDLVDVPPKAKSRSSFKYPPAAKKKGIKGYVILSLLITESGRVDQVQVLESSPAGVFDESAVQGIALWRFEPASYQGKKVKVWAKQKIRFDFS